MDSIVMKVPNIKGNCTLAGYEDCILIDNFDLAAALSIQQDAAMSERVAGRAYIGPVQVRKTFDKSTVGVFQALCIAKSLGEVQLLVLRNDGGKTQVSFKVRLFETLVMGTNLNVGSGLSTETVTLSYAQIVMDHIQQDSKTAKQGTSSAGWNLVKNEAFSAPGG